MSCDLVFQRTVNIKRNFISMFSGVPSSLNSFGILGDKHFGFVDKHFIHKLFQLSWQIEVIFISNVFLAVSCGIKCILFRKQLIHKGVISIINGTIITNYLVNIY